MFNFINQSAIRGNQRILKMELAKITAFFTGFINVFLFIAAWFANLDNAKSSILFIVAMCMSMYRFYRWAINSRQNKKLKDIDIRLKNIQADREELENEAIRRKIYLN